MLESPHLVESTARRSPRRAAWIAGEGHRVAPGLWERYVRGPESGPNPQTDLTELNRPLVR